MAEAADLVKRASAVVGQSNSDRPGPAGCPIQILHCIEHGCEGDGGDR